MANNERVSQLVPLLASELASDDLFLITDMSVRESKRLDLGQLVFFLQNSGSFNALHAVFADTASYILGSNVKGNVDWANNASQSLSSSWSTFAVSSSYAGMTQSASYAINAKNSDSASYLIYTGTPNGTASHAITATSSSFATRAITASFANVFVIGNDGANNEGISNLLLLRGGNNDAAALFVSGSPDNGTFYIRTADNGNEPIRFQTHDGVTSANPVDRVTIDYRNSNSGSTIMTVHGDVSASHYTSSTVNGVGFLGTASYALNANSASSTLTASFALTASNVISASYALTASYATIPPSVYGPKFITPAIVFNGSVGGGGIPYTTYFATSSISSSIPLGTTAVILDCVASTGDVPNVGEVRIRKDATVPAEDYYRLSAFMAGGGGDNVSNASQGCYPCNVAARSFQYTVISPGGTVGITIRLVGYY